MDVTTLCRAVLHAPIKCNIPPVDSHDFSSFHDVLKTPCKNGNLKTQNRFEVGDFLGNVHFFQKLHSATFYSLTVQSLFERIDFENFKK